MTTLIYYYIIISANHIHFSLLYKRTKNNYWYNERRKNILRFLLFFIYVCVVCVHVCRWPWKPEVDVRTPGAGVKGYCEPLNTSARLPNSSLLEEEQVLLIVEPAPTHLWPQSLNSICSQGKLWQSSRVNSVLLWHSWSLPVTALGGRSTMKR